MGRLRQFIRREIFTRVLVWRGRLDFSFGRRARAQNLAFRALSSNPAHFGARLLMGRLHLADGEEADALAEFRIAYQLDPHAVLASDLPVRIREEVVLFASVPDPGPLEEAGLFELNASPDDWARLLQDKTAPPNASFAATDFQDIEEWRRFRDLPPLSRDDLRQVDVDDLARLLSSSDGDPLASS